MPIYLAHVIKSSTFKSVGHRKMRGLGFETLSPNETVYYIVTKVVAIWPNNVDIIHFGSQGLLWL